MSAPVDVLAVMQRDAVCAESFRRGVDREQAKQEARFFGNPEFESHEPQAPIGRAMSDAARAAVAELIAESDALRRQRDALVRVFSDFEIRVERNSLLPPATYMDCVVLSREFQPGDGDIRVDNIRTVLAACGVTL